MLLELSVALMRSSSDKGYVEIVFNSEIVFAFSEA